MVVRRGSTVWHVTIWLNGRGKLASGNKMHSPDLRSRVRTLFWTKTSRTLQGLSRTHFAFFKDSIQCKKEIWVYVFFSSTTTWAILSWRSFILGTWESGLDKVSTEIQGLSSTDYNFQGLSRPWTFYFKFQGLSRTFKVRANPGVVTHLQLKFLRSFLGCYFTRKPPVMLAVFLGEYSSCMFGTLLRAFQFNS